MIVLFLVVVGVVSYFHLDVDKHPDVELPLIQVRTFLPGASPEELEVSITQILEEAVNTVEDLAELRSTSGQGTAGVFPTFNLDRNIETAIQDVRDRVATVIRLLPPDADPPTVTKSNSDQNPSISIALISDRPVRELTELADKVIRQQLERSPGVGEIRINGGLERAVNIWVNPERLAAYQLPINAVRDAIVRQNVDVPGGNVTSGASERNLRTIGRMASARDFNDLVVTTINGAPVRIRDVGWAEDGTKEQRPSVRLDGKPTVTLEIRRQSGANTVAVIAGVKQALGRIASQIPPDVKLQLLEDQSGFIYAALHEINIHLIVGSILASLVVFCFMRNWRAMIIAAVAIPSSLISAFGVMWALNFTLNSVTMLALVLMVGIVIDDAIVVLENVFRFVEEKKMRPFEAAREATADIGLAVMATTFSLVVIFVPVAFMSSISGRFLYQFGLTAAASVLVSLLVSFTLTPMMCARLLKVGGPDMAPHTPQRSGHPGEPGEPLADAARSRTGFYRYIDAAYTACLAWSMRHRWVIVVVSVVVLASTMPIYRSVKQEYIPSDVDESEFEMLVFGPEGMSLAAMDEGMQALAKEARETKGVALTLASAGGGFLN